MPGPPRRPDSHRKLTVWMLPNDLSAATVERARLEAAELTSEGMQDTADRRQPLDRVYGFNPFAEGIEHEDGLRDATAEAMRRDAACSQAPRDA